MFWQKTNKLFLTVPLNLPKASLLIFVTVNFLLTFFLSKYILNTDDFLNHAIAHQITKGEHLYTSITILLPPLNFYLMAALRLLPFDTELSYRLGVGMTSAVSAGVLQLMLRRASGQRLGDILAWFTLFAHFLLIPTMWYGNNAALCVLIGLYFLSKSSPSTTDNILASIALMTAVFFKQNIGIPAVMALFLFSWLDGIKLATLRIAVASMTAIFILMALAMLSSQPLFSYSALFWDHNFTLIQQASTRSITLKHLIFNIWGAWIDFSSPYYKNFTLAYTIGATLLAFAIYLNKRFASPIFVRIWIAGVFVTTCLIVLTRLHSHHAFFNVIFTFVLFLTVILLAINIKGKALTYKIIAPLSVGFAALTGALLKGPWGIVEIYNVVFAMIGLLLSVSVRHQYKPLSYLFIAAFLQLSIYNFAVFIRDFKAIDWGKFEQVNAPHLSGFHFYNKARTYNGLLEADKWLTSNGSDDSYFVFPPEVPLHLIRDDVNKTGIINTSNNILPYALDTTIVALLKANPDIIFWKIDHTQVEANSFFTNGEKDEVLNWILDRYYLAEIITNFKIYKRK